jgi:GNAT superfamily N-acetyltransferase
MAQYHARLATLDDADALVRHRIAMFADMGVAADADVIGGAFRTWLTRMMADGTYRAWLVEDDAHAIVGGGGITVLPWPPGPRYQGGRVAFVYNVYTEPAHRRRGIARLIMEGIHSWCRENGVGSLALNASDSGRTLYEELGYRIAPSPMMFLSLEETPPA